MRAFRRAVLVVLVLSLSVSVAPAARAVDPTAGPKGDDPKSQPSSLRQQALLSASSATISTPSFLTAITISNDLNCSVNHIDDSHGEFYGDTACATLVAVNDVLFGPADIPAGDSASPRTTFTPVSQTGVTGTGTASDPYSITTVVDAGSTGVRLTEVDTYVIGDELFETQVTLANTAASAANIVLYRAGDCYLQNSDFGYGNTDPFFGSVGCLAAVTDGAGNLTKGTRIEEWIPLDNGSNYIEAFYDDVWAAIGTRQPLPDTTEEDQYIDNGAGLSWSFQLPSGGVERHGDLFQISPILANHRECDSEQMADSVPAASGGRVSIAYDARYIVPESEPDFRTKATAIATAIRNRADATLVEYAALGFALPTVITIELRCEIRALDLIPRDTYGFTEAKDKIKIRAEFVRNEFAKGSTGPNAPWHSLVDHELLHTIQLQGMSQATAFVKYNILGDETNIESTAQLGQDLIADADDAPVRDGSYLSLANGLMTPPDSLDVDNPGEGREYQAGLFFQYLGERFGPQNEANLEKRVAAFERSVIFAPALRFGSLEWAMGNPVPIVPMQAYQALRDFYISAAVRRAPNVLNPPAALQKYRYLDEITGHGGVGTGAAYDALAYPPERTKSLPFTFTSETLAHTSGTAYLVTLPSGTTRVKVRLTGHRGLLDNLNPLQTEIPVILSAAIPIGADGSVVVDPAFMRAQVADIFGSSSEMTIPVTGSTKLAIVVTSGGLNVNYDLAVENVTGAEAVTIANPTTAAPIVIDTGDQHVFIPVIVTPTTGGSFQAGLPASAFSAKIDGVPVPVPQVLGLSNQYILLLKPGAALAVGLHDLSVTFGAATAAQPRAISVQAAPATGTEVASVGLLATLGQGGQATTTVAVAPGDAQATFGLGWTGSNFDLTLTSPTGRIIVETTVASDVHVTQGSNTVSIAVDHPEAGTWSVKAVGISVPSPEPVTYQVTERDSTIRSELDLAGPALAGGPLHVRFAVNGGTASSVIATTVDPAGIRRVFPLTDLGGPLDGSGGDGVFGDMLWGTRLPGTYTVSVVAKGTDASAHPFIRTESSTLALGPFTDTDGDGVANISEASFGLDPANGADGTTDGDFDGLNAAAELDAGSNPLVGDSDSGGEGDGSELASGRNPDLAGDDHPFPVVSLEATATDGNKITVALGTLDGTGSVALRRVSDTGTVTDLGTRPGAASTINDGPLPAGTYSYIAWAVDASGAKSGPTIAGPLTPVIDATPPLARISVNGGAVPTGSRTVDVQFSDLSEPVSQMRIAETATALEQAPWVPFVARTTFTVGAGDGFHSILAQVRDAAGLTSAVAYGEVTVDTVKPQSQVLAIPAATNQASLAIPYSASDDRVGVATVEIWYRSRPNAAASWGGWTLGVSVASSPVAFAFPNGEGFYEFYSVGVDRAGNRESAPAAADQGTTFDVTPAASQVGVLAASYATSTVAVPYTATDALSGVALVELWSRYRLNTSAAWGNWTLGPTGTTSPLTFTFGAAGLYEFYTIGVDRAGNREAAPAVADATTTRTTGSPPVVQITSSQAYKYRIETPNGPGSYWDSLTASGQATGTGTVTVDYRVFGVLVNQPQALVKDWTAATPTDGAFDSGSEAYSLSTGFVDPGYTKLVLEVRGHAGGLDASVTKAVAIIYDTAAPTSAIQALPATTTAASINLVGTATDDQATSPIRVQVYARYRSKSNGTWGAWTVRGDQTFPGPASPRPFSFAFAFPNGKGFYEFYSVATDQFGNKEFPALVADAKIEKK